MAPVPDTDRDGDPSSSGREGGRIRAVANVSSINIRSRCSRSQELRGPREAGARLVSVVDYRAVRGSPMGIEKGGDPVALEAHDYRAISLTREGGVVEIRSLIAVSDDDAIAQTTAMLRDLAMDLWDGLRFVDHFAGRVVATSRVLSPMRVLSGL